MEAWEYVTCRYGRRSGIGYMKLKTKQNPPLTPPIHRKDLAGTKYMGTIDIRPNHAQKKPRSAQPGTTVCHSDRF